MILQEMFSQGAKARERRRLKQEQADVASAMGALVGQAPIPDETKPYNQGQDEIFPGEAPIAGLENIITPGQKGTGLMNPDVTPYNKFTTFNKGLMESELPTLQKQGLNNIKQIQSSMLSSTASGGSPTTFAMGAGDGQMVRGYFDNGALKTAGQSYDPRDLYKDVKTGYVNPYAPDSFVPKNLSQAEADTLKGRQDQERMAGYNTNLAKAEAGIEQIDLIQDELNNLTKNATGWSTGFGSWLKSIPTSDANAWESAKTTVLSGLGLDKIAEMKSQSQTGATGFGALNAQELELLVSYRGKLEQANSTKEIKRVITRMQRLLDNARTRAVRRVRNEQTWFNKNTKKYSRNPVAVAELPAVATEPAGSSLQPNNTITSPGGITFKVK